MAFSTFEAYERLAGEDPGRWTEMDVGERLVLSGRGGWLGWTAVKRRSPDVLRGGALAALADLDEERERDQVDAALVETDRALRALGVDRRAFFDELATAVPKSLADAVRRFGRREDVEPDLSAFARADREAAERILGELLPAESGTHRRIAAALALLASGDLERLRTYADEARAGFDELPHREPSPDDYHPMTPEERAERARRRRSVTGPLGRARAARSPDVLRAGLVVDAIRHEHSWLWKQGDLAEHVAEYAAAARELGLEPGGLFGEVAPVLPESMRPAVLGRWRPEPGPRRKIGEGLAAALGPWLNQRMRGQPRPPARDEDMAHLRRMVRDGDWDAIADLARRRRSPDLLSAGLHTLVEEAADRGDEAWLRRHLGEYESAAWAIGIDPGAIFESSVRDAPAEIAGTVRGFTGRPPMAERVEAAIARLARGDPERLRVFRNEAEPSLRRHLEREAEAEAGDGREPLGDEELDALLDRDPVLLDAPTRALRARSPDILLGALVVDIVIHEDFYFQDWRDLLGAMAPYHHCAAALGLDTRAFFEEAAAAGPSSLAEYVRNFGHRGDITESAWSFDLVQEPEGPAYYGR